MSTALSHLWPERGEMLSGSAHGYNYADLLKEQFEPEAETDLIDEILADVERRLRGSTPDDDSPPVGPATS